MPIPPYTEYFNTMITEDNYYYDYTNYCSHYGNYTDHCLAAHYDVATRGSHYYNYYNQVIYSNYTNTCSAAYFNTWSYESSNKHANNTAPTWNSPWGGSLENRTLGVDYISGSIDAIKNIRDEITALSGRKSSLKSGFNIDTATNSVRIGDQVFDDEDSGTDEFVEDLQHDALQESLDDMWLEIKGSAGSGLPVRSPGDIAAKAEIEDLANTLDDVATTTTAVTYANHFDTTYANRTYTPGEGDVD